MTKSVMRLFKLSLGVGQMHNLNVVWASAVASCIIGATI